MTTEDDGDFGLIDSFHVDNGELDGLTPQLIFVLGCELGAMLEKIDRDFVPFEMMFHSDNEIRFRKILDKRGVDYQIFTHDDFPLLNVSGVPSI